MIPVASPTTATARSWGTPGELKISDAVDRDACADIGASRRTRFKKAAVHPAEALNRAAAADSHLAEVAAAHNPVRQAGAGTRAAGDMVPHPGSICGHMAPGASPAGTAAAAHTNSSSAPPEATRSD
jgi:hypothetical protein